MNIVETTLWVAASLILSIILVAGIALLGMIIDSMQISAYAKRQLKQITWIYGSLLFLVIAFLHVLGAF